MLKGKTSLTSPSRKDLGEGFVLDDTKFQISKSDSKMLPGRVVTAPKRSKPPAKHSNVGSQSPQAAGFGLTALPFEDEDFSPWRSESPRRGGN